MKSRVLITMVAMSLLLIGCTDSQSNWDHAFGKGASVRAPGAPRQPEQPTPPQMPPAPQVAPAPQTSPAPPVPQVRQVQQTPQLPQRPAPLNPNVVSQIYPCEGGGNLRLDKQIPAQVELNAPFEYTIKVSNLCAKTVNNIIVREQVANNFNVLGSHPQGIIDHDSLVWRLGSIAPGLMAQITIRGVATSGKPVSQCSLLTFGKPICVTAEVVQPELVLIKVIPEEAMICDAIPMRIGVKNIGTGTAQNVVIHDVLPDDMESVRGESKLTFHVGALASGQSAEFSAELVARRVGRYQNMATATSSNAATVESALVGVNVGRPVLEIKKTGPSKRLLGTTLSYQITLVNRGDVAARDLILEDDIPIGTTPYKTNYGGVETNGRMLWNLPDLPPQGRIVVEIVYQANREGTYTSQAVARATCANPVSASTETVVEGVPAILLEVVDVKDPIQLGGYESYLITTTSQGTSASTNVRIACQLEDNVEYASAEGPTQATLQGRTVSFRPLPHLAPGEKATWKVVVRAVEAGDARFKVTLTTDQLRRPVEETESTRLYE